MYNNLNSKYLLFVVQIVLIKFCVMDNNRKIFVLSNIKEEYFRIICIFIVDVLEF